MGMTWSEYKAYREKKKKEEQEKAKAEKKQNSSNKTTNNNVIQKQTGLMKESSSVLNVNKNNLIPNTNTWQNIINKNNTSKIIPGNNNPLAKIVEEKNENNPLQKAIKEQQSKPKTNTQETTSTWDRIMDNARLGGYGGIVGTAQTGYRDIRDIDNAYTQGSSYIRNTLLSTLFGEQGANLGKSIDEKIYGLNEGRNKFYNYALDILNQEQQSNTQKAQQNVEEVQKSGDKVGTKFTQLAQSIGQNAVGMAATAVNPALGFTYYKMSSEASYYDDALNRGMTEDQAKAYSKIMSYVEAGTETLSAGNVIKGGKVLKATVAGAKTAGVKVGVKAGFNVLKEGAKEEVVSSFKNALKSYGIGIAEEAFQEGITEPLQELTAMATAGKDKADWSNMPQRIFNSAFDGALSSLVLAGSNMGISTCQGVVTKLNNNQQVNTQEFNQAVKDASKELDAGKILTDNFENEVNKVKTELQTQDNKSTNQETKTSQTQTSQAENQAKMQAQNNLAKVKQFYDESTYNQMKEFIETAPSEEALNQINEDIKTETKNKLEETYKSERFTESQDRKRTYAQYQRQNNTTGINYDNSVVNNALDTVAPNRNGRRTVGQWKQVAEQIGLNSTDLTKSQIDDIAYGSWFDLQPTKNITRYDNRTKEHKGFEKFTSDDWINTIYESAKGQKLQKLDTVLNSEPSTSQNIEVKQTQENIQSDNMNRFNNATKKIDRETISNLVDELDIKIKDGAEKIENTEMSKKSGHNKQPKFVNIDPIFDKLTKANKKSLRKEAINKALELFRDKLVKIKDIKDIAQIRKEGIKKTFSGDVTNEKIQSANNIEDIVREGIYKYTTKNKDVDNGVIYHHFFTPVNYNGKNGIVRIVIKEDVNDSLSKNRFYYHQLEYMDNIKEESNSVLTSESPDKNFEKDSSFINNSIPQNNQNVKSDNTNINNMQNNQENMQQFSMSEQQKQNNFEYKESKNSKVDTFRKDASKYWDNSEKTNKLVNTIEKVINDKGYNIRLDDTLGDNVNGRIVTNNQTGEIEITLNPNSSRTGEFILGHELTHAIQTQEMIDLVNDRMTKDGDLRNAVEDLKKLYNTDEINAEVLADISGQLFGNQEFINNLSIEKPSVFKRIYDKIISLANKITGNSNEALFIKDLKNKWEKAYRDNTNKISEAQYSKNATNLPEVKEGYTRLYRGLESEYNPQYDKNKLDNVNGYESWTDDYDLAKSYGNNVYYIDIPTSEIKNSIIDEDSTSETYGDRNLIYKNDKPVGINGKNGNEYMLYTEHDNYKNIKYNKTNNQATAQDNQGRQLSKEQQDYFKDSKVRDENGKLLTVYHGTNSEFNVFDLTKGGQSNTGASIGFWFTETKQGAENFANDVWYGDKKPNVKENYLDLKNPKIYENVKNEGLQEQYRKQSDELENKAKELRKKYSWDKTDYKTTMTFDTLIRDYQTANYQKKDVDIALFEGLARERGFNEEQISDMERDAKEYVELLQESKKAENEYYKLRYGDAYEQFKIDLYETAGQSAEEANTGGLGMALNNPKETIEKFRNKLIKEGYDGIIIKNTQYDNSNFNGENNQYVAFYPNQIKNVDNTNPTSNPDIRYSKQNQSWQEYLEKNYKSEGTRTDLRDIRLPMKQEVKAPIKQENTKVKFDNEVMKTNSEIKGNSETSEKVAKILSEPTKNVKPEQRTWAILKANFIDKGAVFEKISQKTNNRDLQGKYDYTLTAGARGQYAIGNDRYVYSNGKKTLQSKSLTSIMDEVGENTQAFNEYMYHQLNVDRMTLDERFGIENKPVFGESITADVSRAEIAKIEEQHPEFKEYANDVYKYLEANKQELVDRGVISQETSDFFKERYPHYVPIQRATRKGNSIDVALDTKRTGINSPIKKAKGGNQDINPLFQTMASQTLQTYRASARNNFGLELKNTLQQMNQLNENRTIADIDDIVDTMTNEEQNNELLQPGKKGENPTFTVFEDGKKITYDISQDMYDALKPKSEILNKLDNTKLAKAGRKISNFRRGVLTEYNPIFSITNAIKDAQDVLINSQHSAKTYAKFPEAYAQIVKKGYWYNEYIQNGGEQNSYFTEGDFENIKSSKLDKAKNVLKFPLEKISQVNNVIEMAPRLAEYIVSRQNGANIETAMLDASRVTTNFKAGGDITKFANRNGATFLNASVQGFQQQVRNIQEANMKGLKGWTNLALKYTIAGLPALLLNNLFWDDDDDYEQLQDYVKDNYYVIAKLPNGNFLRIPKGRMTATIQKVVSNANDFVKDGKINSDDVASTIWNDLKEDVSFGMDNLAPNNPIDNNILSPIIQVAQNKTWYGDDLVPQRLQDVPEEEQADESTDKLSRWLGEKLGKSPKKINYLLDQYSGGIGDVLLPLGTPQAENNVIEDKFTTDPVMKSQYPSDFFSKVDELNVKHNSIKATDEDILKYKYISSVQQEVSSLYKQKREIQASDKNDATKKQELKEVQKQINKLAKDSLENVDNVKISGESATIGDKQYYKNKGTWTKLTDKEKEKLNGTSTSVYSDYKNATNDLSDKEKIQTLRDSNYSKSDKSNLYEKTISTDKYYPTLKKSGIDIDEYMDYKLAQSNGDFTADKKNGKTVMGSGKKKVLNYLNKNITGYGNRLLIAGKQYSLTDSQRKDLSNYINKTFATQAERTEVYKQLKLNFVVNGNKVTYK